jgi:hypothetical protein
MKKSFWKLLVVVALLEGCQKESEQADQDILGQSISSTASQPQGKGIGKSTEFPVGTPWAPPDGIRGTYKADYKCLTENLKKQRGSGMLVRICVVLTNTNPAGPDIPVVIPEGTVFVSEDDAVQNGLLITNLTVMVPANSSKSFLLALYCLNKDRAPTNFNNNVYTPGPVTKNAELLALAAQHKGLEINGEFPRLDSKLVAEINQLQNKIWEVTEK